MTRPVTIVLPSLDTTDLFEENLPGLLEELERRGVGDEVVVVDDTGDDVLRPWLAERFASVRVVPRAENGGFAAALTDGIRAATHELVFSMNTDVYVRPGFLDPLVACLADPNVFAAVPRVLLKGEESKIESLTGITERRGLWELRQPCLAPRRTLDPAYHLPTEPTDVAFAVGGTCLMRVADFFAMGGFASWCEPFYFEDVDLCWRAWRDGRRTVYVPDSVLEHRHRGTIGKVVPPEVVRAVVEKNRFLFQWRHLDEPDLARAHVAAVLRRAVDAWTTDRRESLIWLCLALEQRDEVMQARREGGDSTQTFREIVDRTQPR